jgi:hypothetical protein
MVQRIIDDNYSKLEMIEANSFSYEEWPFRLFLAGSRSQNDLAHHEIQFLGEVRMFVSHLLASTDPASS